MGKTTLLQNCTNSEKRLIIIDPVRQFRNGLIVLDVNSLFDYFEKFDPGVFRVICRFRDDKEFTQTEKVLELAQELKDLTLVIDEVDKICSPDYLSEQLRLIINYGRHDRINLFTSARRPADVARALTSNADEVITFRVEEPNDLDYLKKRGFDVEKIKSLKKFDYLSNN